MKSTSTRAELGNPAAPGRLTSREMSGTPLGEVCLLTTGVLISVRPCHLPLACLA